MTLSHALSSSGKGMTGHPYDKPWSTVWEALLEEDAEAKTQVLTTKLLALQQQHVHSWMYLTRLGDPA